MKIVNPIGRKGETAAAHFLHDKGYKIVELNYRRNYTEIDIIALYEDTTVFVEVKARTSGQFGTPFEAITRTKINNLVKTAYYYMSIHKELPKAMRVDAIGLTLSEAGEVEDIEHIENISGF